jgi:cytochrome c556
MKKISVLLTGSILAISLNFPATADDYDPEALIEYRQDSMEAIKSHNNAIKAILQNKVPFDDQLGMHMSSLEALLNDVGSLFPDGSDFGETNAKDAIWDKPEKFEKAVTDANKAFAEFKAIVAKGDKPASADALKKFGKASCGNCHKSFKKKDD